MSERGAGAGASFVYSVLSLFRSVFEGLFCKTAKRLLSDDTRRGRIAERVLTGMERTARLCEEWEKSAKNGRKIPETLVRALQIKTRCAIIVLSAVRLKKQYFLRIV